MTLFQLLNPFRALCWAGIHFKEKAADGQYICSRCGKLFR